jgi:hypothetical protein
MKINKETISLVVFGFCFICWMTVFAITPVGGWNPSSSTYNSMYQPAFGITSVIFLASIYWLFRTLTSNFK